ncbi:MAG: sensor histidine kinase [Bacteroidia bacterium]
MSVKYKIIVVSILLFFQGSAFSQLIPEFEYRYYNKANGLNATNIFCITPIHTGELLIGSENGVFSHNGHEFRKPKFSAKIGLRPVTEIIELENHDILIYAENPNIVFLIRKDSMLANWKIEGNRDIRYKVSFARNQNTIYTKRENEIFKIDIYNDPVQEKIISEKKINSFFSTSNGQIYIYNNEHLKLFENDICTNIYKSELGLFWCYFEYENHITIIDRDSLFVFDSKNLLYKSNFENNRSKGLAHPKFIDANGNKYFTFSSPGLFKLDQSNKLSNIFKQFSIPKETFCSAYYKSKNNIHWIGTIDQGLIKIKESLVQKEKMFTNKNITCLAINKKKQSFLVGTSTGLFDNEANVIPLTLQTDTTLTAPFITSIKHTNNQWYVSSLLPNYNNTLDIQHKKTLIHIKNGPFSDYWNNSHIYGFWNRFRISSLTNALDTSFKATQFVGRINNGFNDSSIYYLLGDGAIFELKSENKNIIIDSIKTKIFKTGNYGITFNHLLKKGQTFYLSTSKGLFSFNRDSNDQFINVKKLNTNNCRMSISLNDSLMISLGLNALNIFKVSSGENIFKIPSPSGLTFNTIHKYSDDKFLITSSKGLYSLLKSKLLNLKSGKSIIKFESFEIDGISSLELPINFKNNTNSIKLNLTSINTNLDKAPKYFYTLNNGSPVQTTTNQLKFENLRAGTYTLNVWAVDEYNKISNKLTKTFIIQLPLWRKPWFISIITTSIITALILIFYVQKNIEKRKRDIQSHLIHLERKALNLSLNPHFLFNSLNIIQQHASATANVNLINFVSDFSMFFRKVLESNEKSMILLSDEMDLAINYLNIEKARYDNIFTYTIKKSKKVDELELEVPPMLLQPFLENAIVHGISELKNLKQGLIEIEIKLDSGFLNIIITDNGVGLKNGNSQNEHLGIAISRKRLQLINKENSIKLFERSSIGQQNGTMVVMKLKLSQDQINSNY